MKSRTRVERQKQVIDKTQAPTVTLHLVPGITLVCFSILFRVFIASSLHSNRGLLHIKPDEVPAEVCPDFSTKMTLSFFGASVSVRDLSTNSSANSGI